ncbi:MAG: hypothetical protein ACT4OV_14855 [Microthrixaceae bacterium]
MSIRRLIVAAVIAAALAGGAAFAAAQTLTSRSLAAGHVAVARCDATPTWTYSFGKNAGGQVTSVTVTDVDAGCFGGAMSLALKPVNAIGGPVSVSSCAATCSVTVPLTSNPLPSQVTSVLAVVVGP